jgi:hypothetical protein
MSTRPALKSYQLVNVRTKKCKLYGEGNKARNFVSKQEAEQYIVLNKLSLDEWGLISTTDLADFLQRGRTENVEFFK